MSELKLRAATPDDAATLDALIARSVHGLQADTYTQAQRDAALGSVFGVDHRLIADGGYLVAEIDGAVVGCGGWSDREALYGAHGPAQSEGPRVNPASGPARVRAFFVDPAFARRGIGRALLQASEDAARAAGFTRAALGATLAGAPFYAAHGYVALARTEADLPGGATLTVIQMEKRLSRAGAPPLSSWCDSRTRAASRPTRPAAAGRPPGATPPAAAPCAPPPPPAAPGPRTRGRRSRLPSRRAADP